MTGRHLIAVDWGTSNFRAFLVDRKTGECLDSRRSAAGLRALSTGEFPRYCAAQLRGWRDGTGVPVYLAGMVGSARGWCEAPQLETPAGPADLAGQLVPAPGLDQAWIVPGLKTLGDDHLDVMRGEEIQAFGALALRGITEGVCCLPGTHSKWARLSRGRLIDFTTMMTGELYHAVRHHTLVGEPSRGREGIDEGGFRQGLAAARHPAGLLHALFEARSRHLHGGLGGESVAGFLSGVLIGSEVLARLGREEGEVSLVGSPSLNGLYRLALEAYEVPVIEVDSDRATLAGIVALAERHESRRNP
ncbi:2-dehydro-3-deoxygalactonokinase [Halomonas koreensis]|uniref:2-dehydro-3-deoxygalactonokinase n=1 Tax=Halomonas koreensis TaxID=245385 RepID=A0ABU1G5F3_9GAMM|nr:2-dehydro-3-deoxygalactonokinase [Halomonas koreensis]MDR5867753.1 2-dehydro-3-deoxygalactonokinase [Halomonas koreensis]